MQVLRCLSTFFGCVALILGLGGAAPGQVFINEIFFDPPGELGDQQQEYIELRGTPNMSLDDHYLIMIENESARFSAPTTGEIENMFDLSGRTLGENGFLTLRQLNSPYTVAEGTTDLVEEGGTLGWATGEESTVGSFDEQGDGRLENGGFTAMLIHNVGGTTPVLGLDLDVGDDGLDPEEEAVDNWRANWEILDAIGFTEPGEAFTARYYAHINFGTEMPVLDETDPDFFDPADHIEEGATYVGLGYEIEYIGRWGNSTGQTADDWHISNVTDDVGSGYFDDTTDFRQSGDPHSVPSGDPSIPPDQPIMLESNQEVPYGTIITNTLGAPNYRTGDFDKDGFVTMADLAVWEASAGETGSEDSHHPADANHDFLVDELDRVLWEENVDDEQLDVTGDYNNNGSVEQADLDLVLLNWGETTPPVPDNWTNDLPTGSIDQAELDNVLLNWGSGSPVGATSVPEPATWVIGLVFAVAVACCRKWVMARSIQSRA